MTRTPRRQKLPDLAPLIDQALLDPLLGIDRLQEACTTARHCGFGGICTNLSQLVAVREQLGAPGPTQLIAVIAFPFGAIPTPLKRAQAEWAAEQGAEALDVVPAMTALADGQVNRFAEELAQLSAIGLPVTVILDMVRLKEEQLALAVEAAIDAGATAVQNSNGFGGAATPQQIRALKTLTRGRCGIKAAGGVHTLEQCSALIEAGATALGTSSGPQLLQALRTPITGDSSATDGVDSGNG
ncbi:MAG: deoxyribose-phosphate aldolase [Synechococcus sp.]